MCDDGKKVKSGECDSDSSCSGDDVELCTNIGGIRKTYMCHRGLVKYGRDDSSIEE